MVTLPCKTYPSVPMVVLQAGHTIFWEDYDWSIKTYYTLEPFTVIDSARHFWEAMYASGTFSCVSFHPQKCLALSTGGGAILHDNEAADAWFRRARFDGRHEGVPTKDDNYDMMGWHCYLMPPAAAEGLQRLSVYREVNLPVEHNYPDLSKWPLFQQPYR
jgi:hypothetical protein